MQAIFFMGLFGAFYATVLATTIFLSQSATQRTQGNVADVQQLFEEVEFAVNKGIVPTESDLAGYPSITANVDASLLDVGQYLSWNQDQLLNDPWGNPIEVHARMATFNSVRRLYADGSGNEVLAPVWSFVLVSPGPDRQLEAPLATAIAALDDPGQTDTNNAYTRILRLEASAGSDDIVHTFSTKPAMRKLWRRAQETHTRIIAYIQKDFQVQFEMFLPTIEGFYEGVLQANPTDLGELGNALDEWWVDAALQADVTYPRMRVENIVAGAQILEGIADIDRSISPFALDIDDYVVNVGVVGTEAEAQRRTRAVVELYDTSDGDTGPDTSATDPVDRWSIRYIVLLDGREFIGAL